MRPLLKFAWVNLTVVAVIVIALIIQFFISGVFELSPAVIALFIADIFVFKYSKAKVIQDERDVEIERQATLAGLWAVFIYFIAAGLYVIFDFDKSPIGHKAFLTFFSVGYVLFLLVLSMVIVVLFGSEREKNGGKIESLREITNLQKEALISLPIIALLMIYALLRFPVSGSTPYDISLGIALLLIPILSFFLFPFFIHTGRAYEYFRPVISRARKVMLQSALVATTVGLLSIAALYVLKDSGAIYLNLFLVAGFFTFSTGSLVFWACLLFSPVTLAEKAG